MIAALWAREVMSDRVAMAPLLGLVEAPLDAGAPLIEFADHEPGRLDQRSPVRAVGDVLTP
ncbi:hypothetical protein [Nocardia farcinica]|uniref:hypothetical protein n=1 Tax=Nocardia farcinica TaxID=37329 RepID=UPI0022B9EC4F|nr:hypothetical protein [Nocardia farcinica]MCZ9326771.1 hypothetical protein [Nocardia farcinica]